jgi:Protein of unknown function (DUF2726)
MLFETLAPIIVAAAGCCAALGLLAGLTRRKTRFRAADYRAKPLLTRWELAALHELRLDLPAEFHVCPQVRLADLVDLTERDPKRRWAALGRVASKSVDFAIVDSFGRVVLVIELDDRTHDRPDRRERDRQVDALLQRCGIPVRRVRPGQRVNARAELGRAPQPRENPLPGTRGRAVRAGLGRF